MEARVHTSSVMMRRDLAVALGGFDSELVYAEDYDLWARAAIRSEVVTEDAAERLLCRPVRRPVIVRQVEVRDPEVEGPAHDRATGLQGALAAEVLPEAERDRRQVQPAAAAAAVSHAAVAVLGGDVGHGALNPTVTGR